MADQTIGVARIGVEIDTTKVEAGTNRAKAAVAGLGTAAEDSSRVQVSASNRTIQSLQRQVDTFGLSREELIRWRIQNQTSGETADKLSAALDRQASKARELAAATDGQSKSITRGGVSLGQYNNALRQLPAQYTDIVTQIAGGQNIGLILLQQGGQIKDSFGSISGALSGVASSAAAFINPLTVGAAAIAALGVAAYQGSQEFVAYDKALLNSGNSAGVTSEALGELAGQFDEMSGVTVGAAADALAQVAATGAFTADQLKVTAQAALEWQVATGDAVDGTIKQFVKLADDPVKAIVELNTQMGFLTESQLKAIEALVAVGDHAGAADMAINLYADTVKKRTEEMIKNAGALEWAWLKAGAVIKEAWDSINSIGRKSTIDELNAGITIMRKNALDPIFKRSLGGDAAFKDYLRQLDEQIAQRDALVNKQKADGQTPEQRRELAANSKLREQNLQEEEATAKRSENLSERLEVVRTRLARAGATDREAIAKAEALETAKFQEEQERKTKKPRGDGDGGLANARLSAIKAQGSAEQATIAAQTKDVQDQYRARSISANDYYERLRALAAQSTAAEVNTLQQQIAATEEQSKSRKSSAAVAEQVTALEAQLNKVRAEGESKLRSITAQEDDARRKREEGLRAYREALAAQTATLRDQMSNMVDRESMGSREFEVQSKINDVYAEQARRLREIADAQGQGNLSVDDANVRRDSLRSEVQERVEVIKQGYADVDAARLDFSNGVQRGFAEFATSSLDVAGQVASAMGSAFGGMEDALVNFAKTGKLSFKELANSILEDLTRIAIKIALTKALEGMFGGGGATAAAGNSAVSSGTGAILSKLGGFSSGGYTGDGGKNDPAGVVHKGEVVFSQDDVARAGGVSAVERMRLGAQGSLSSTGSSTGATGGVVVNLIGLDKAPKEQRQSQVNGQMQIDMIFEEIDSRAAEGVANGTSRLAMALGRKG